MKNVLNMFKLVEDISKRCNEKIFNFVQLYSRAVNVNGPDWDAMAALKEGKSIYTVAINTDINDFEVRELTSEHYLYPMQIYFASEEIANNFLEQNKDFYKNLCKELLEDTKSTVKPELKKESTDRVRQATMAEIGLMAMKLAEEEEEFTVEDMVISLRSRHLWADFKTVSTAMTRIMHDLQLNVKAETGSDGKGILVFYK